MFDWANKTYFPKFTDLFNMSDLPNTNWLDMFTYIWISFMGDWFYGMIIGAIGAALYVKYENAPVTITYFIVMTALFTAVLPSIFLFIVGSITGITIGIVFYEVFFRRDE